MRTTILTPLTKFINDKYFRLIYIYISQAARQGLAVLMASASVVLTHETSTLRQRHNFISIALKFGVRDYVREITSPAKFGSGPISGRAVLFF